MAKKKTVAPEVEIKYVKSNGFQTHTVGGVYGGIGGNAMINMNFYTDCLPLPEKAMLKLDTKNQSIESIEQFDKPSLEREVVTRVLMDLNHASDFHLWLGGKIKELEQRITKE